MRNPSLLNNRKKLEKIVRRAINRGGLGLEHLHSHQFSPVGITVIAIVSESHLAIHTYPESGHVSVDIYTCSADSLTNERIWASLISALHPRRVQTLHVERGKDIVVQHQPQFSSRSTTGLKILYDIRRHLLHQRSQYQTIDIVDTRQFGKMLFLDGDVQIAEKDARLYNRALVDPLGRGKQRRAIILGGGDGGVLYEVLKLQPKQVVVVDIDRAVISAAQEYLTGICHGAFRDRRVRIVIGNVLKFLSKQQAADVVIYDLTSFPERLVELQRQTFLTTVLRRIRRVLVPNGILTLQCGSALDKQQLCLTKRYVRQYFPNVSFTETFISSYGEPWVFATATKEVR